MSSLNKILKEADQFLSRAQARGRVKASVKESRKGKVDARLTASLDESTVENLNAALGSFAAAKPRASGKKSKPKKAAPAGLSPAQIKRLIAKATEEAVQTQGKRATGRALAEEKYKNMPPALRAAMLKKLGF